MPDTPPPFDIHTARTDWDAAADAYADAQATGLDVYRLALFGPAQVALCGDVRGLRLIDVGCGTGYFAREMAQRGALVTGIDFSPAMLAHATAMEAAAPLGIRYLSGDAARLHEQVPPDAFDIATACLSLQDMSDIAGAFAAVRHALRPGGRLVMSIAHPCSDTPFRRWAKDAAGAKQWLCIDRYFERGPIRYHWKGWKYDFSTAAQHATLEDWLGWAFDAGFTLRALREPQPSQAAVHAHPELADAARVPYFLLLDLARAA
jgi:SAM-dependent methyltransferase